MNFSIAPVDELGRHEQTTILHVVETGRFLAMGSDQESSSRLQLIADEHLAAGD